MNKKGLFLCPSSTLGGAERVLINLLSPFADPNFNHSGKVVLPNNGPLEKEIESIGLPIAFKRFPHGLNRLGDSPSNRMNYLVRSLSLIRALPGLSKTIITWRRDFTKDRPDWVHSNGFKTHLLASLTIPLKIPIVWHLHDFVSDRPLMRNFLKWAWRSEISALAVSQAVADDFLNVIPDCPVRVLYNSIDCKKFAPKNSDGAWLDKAAGLIDRFQGLRVGLVATYARWKGQETFIDACSILAKKHSQSVRFYIVGGPVYQTTGSQWSEIELRKKIHDHGLDGKVGLIPFQENTTNVYNSLDIIVHASTRKEPFGLVIAEAMACGKPVVAALGGGAAEIGEEGTDCIGHQAGNPESLANSIEKLLVNPNFRLKLGSNGRQRILEKFNAEKIKQNWIQLFSGLEGG